MSRINQILMPIFLLLLLLPTIEYEGLNAELQHAGSIFKDVHIRAGIKTTGDLGHSATWVDVNKDGCIDLIATNTSIRKPPRTFLFYNQCDGSFIDKDSGISKIDLIRASSAADFDNDGNIDILMGGIDVYGTPTLYQNIGSSEFVDVSEIANISGEGYASSITWTDFNLDGNIDIFQSGKVYYLYRNECNGSFLDITFDSGIRSSSANISSLWFDYNNDRLPDVFLSNKNYNNLFRNNGDGSFENVTKDAKLAGDKTWKTVGACSGDYDNDGYLDLYVVNISSERKSLYRNNGDGSFTDVTVQSGTEDVGDGRTCSFVDYNSDGYLDIFTTNHIRPSKLYRNNGDGTFTNVADTLGVDFPFDGFSATWGDFNGDATMDVFINGHMGIALYQGSNQNNSVVIELVGDGINTNTSAIGSRIEVKTESKTQLREILGGKGCCENDMLPAHFGLGKENEFALTVTWTNGSKCNYQKLNAGERNFYKIFQKECHLESY